MSHARQHRQPRPRPKLERLPRAVYARVESFPAGTWVPAHRHDWVQLTYAISGVLQIKTSGCAYLAPRQRAVWIPPGVDHEVLTSQRAEFRSLYLAREVAGWARPCVRVLEISPLVRELIRAVSALPVDYDAEGAPGRLVAVLLDRLQAAPEVSFHLPLPTDSRLTAICDVLQDQPDDQRTLAEWAKVAAASERTLERLFLRETGVSFREWRQRLRLLLALTALESGESVTAVALDSGYASPSSFIAAFKRLFGKTPTQLFSADPP